MSFESRQLVVEGVAAASVTYVLWRLLQSYLNPDPLLRIRAPPKGSIIAGNMEQVFNPHAWEYHDHIAREYGTFFRLNGFMGGSFIHTFDPKAMHHILVKDQHIYEETENLLLTHRLTFGKGLLSIEGDQHRRQRKLINPVFSIAHLREQVPVFYEVAYKTRETFMKMVSDGPKEVDVLSWMTRTALELIGQSGLGHSFDPLTEGTQEHPYCTSIKNFMPVLNKFLFSRFFVLPTASKLGSPRFQRWVVDMLPWKKLHTLRDMVDIMDRTSRDIYEARKAAIAAGDEKAVAAQAGRGKDIISILVKANMVASEEDRLPDDEVLGQLSTITFAAMDTTSSALSRIIWLLSENPEVQARLREEIREARRGLGDLQYDDLSALPFLDAVVRETLRLHPPVPFVSREARQNAVLPLDNPITLTDGTVVNEAVIPQGTVIIASILASNRNPALWGPDAAEWKPERWMSPLPEPLVKAKIPGVYSHLMTFIGGGRSCVGFKFSQLEIKVVLSLLLESFQFDPSPGKEICWRLNGVTAPSVKGVEDDPENPKLQMPLRVSLAPQ